MAPNKLTLEIVFEYFQARLKKQEEASLRSAGRHFHVSPMCVSSYVDILLLEKKLFKLRRKFFLREEDALVPVKAKKKRIAQAGRHITASKGGKTSSAMLKARAEAMGVEHSAFIRYPAADDAKLAERIERVVANAIGQGGGYKQTFIRAGGSKVG